MKKRTAQVTRKTRETDIRLTMNLDGKGASKIDTGMGFFDHMLELFAKHSLIDMDLKARGDLRVDAHHTVEDVGICIGQALTKALGQKKGIARYGFYSLPMDEALVSVSLDLSGRPYLRYEVKSKRRRIGSFDLSVIEEFFQALASNAGLTLHIEMVCGKNPHHITEAVFKGFAKALSMAIGRSGRDKGIPSTKGRL
jgi:imidazoleglycerol-phosphate dehydratase